jgi:hypothetical protein
MHFLLRFHLNVLYKDSIYNIWGGEYGLKKITTNFNQQITMDVLMIKFGPYFQKSQSWSFFIGLIYFPP